MREGYWINHQTGKVVPVNDHEQWIREPQNAKEIGVPRSVHSLAVTIKNREKYLLFLMQHAPIIRVRGHGTDVTFEFHSRDRNSVMDAIWMWGKKNAGPFTWLNVVNFATGENTQMSFEDFDKQMDSGGSESVLRVAKRMPVLPRIEKELRALSKQIRP